MRSVSVKVAQIIPNDTRTHKSTNARTHGHSDAQYLNIIDVAMYRVYHVLDRQLVDG